MNIEYFNPLSNAWNRMKKALFQPFDIGKWFALGFTVFLAQLLNGGGGGGGGGNIRDSSGGGTHVPLPEIARVPEIAMEWIAAHLFLAMVLSMAALIIIGVILVLTWLSSRGVFMFLDNVVHDRALIAKPWRKYKILSHSLFFWRVGFGLVTVLLLIPLLVLVIVQIIQLSRGYSGLDTILSLAAIGFIFFVGSILAAYISLFTTSFIVPIMYRHDLRILQAWRKFLPILKSHWPYFLLYGLLILLLYIGVIITAVLAGCLTCCIGFVLLMLPYIGSVVLLPVHYTLRAFSLEFLAQWGADYSVFPDESMPTDDMPPPPPPAPPATPPAGVTIIGM